MGFVAATFLAAALVAGGLAAAVRSTRLLIAAALLHSSWCVSFIVRHVLAPVWPETFDPNTFKLDDPLVGTINLAGFALLTCRFPDEIRAGMKWPLWALVCSVGEVYLFLFVYHQADTVGRYIAIQAVYAMQILIVIGVSARALCHRWRTD